MGHPVGTMTDALAAGNLVIFARECPEKDTPIAKAQHMKDTSPRQKDSPQLCGGEPDEEEKEKRRSKGSNVSQW